MSDTKITPLLGALPGSSVIPLAVRPSEGATAPAQFVAQTTRNVSSTSSVSQSPSVTIPSPSGTGGDSTSTNSDNPERDSRKRRRLVDLQDNELWRCPYYPCKKVYSQKSTASIQSHKKNCPIAQTQQALNAMYMNGTLPPMMGMYAGMQPPGMQPPHPYAMPPAAYQQYPGMMKMPPPPPSAPSQQPAAAYPGYPPMYGQQLPGPYQNTQVPPAAHAYHNMQLQQVMAQQQSDSLRSAPSVIQQQVMSALQPHPSTGFNPHTLSTGGMHSIANSTQSSGDVSKSAEATSSQLEHVALATAAAVPASTASSTSSIPASTSNSAASWVQFPANINYASMTKNWTNSDGQLPTSFAPMSNYHIIQQPHASMYQHLPQAAAAGTAQK